MLNVTLIKHCLLISLSWYIVISSQLRTVLNRRVCEKTCTFSRISYVINLRQQKTRRLQDRHQTRESHGLQCHSNVNWQSRALRHLKNFSKFRASDLILECKAITKASNITRKPSYVCNFFSISHKTQVRVKPLFPVYITEQSMLTCVLMSDTTSLFMNIRTSRL